MKHTVLKMVFMTFMAALFVLPINAFAAQKEIRIGCLLPFSGPLAKEGSQTWHGISVAADIVNDNGGLFGKKIVFVKGDSQTVESAVSEAERLINVEKLDMIVGGYSSSRVFAASEITEKYKKIFWIATAAAANITQRGYKYIFRNNASSNYFGIKKVAFLINVVAPGLGKKPQDLRVAIVHEDSGWGTFVSTGEEAQAKKYDLNVIMKESYNAGATDLSPLILQLKAKKADVILWTGYINDTNLFWRQAHELDFNVPVLLGSGAAMAQYEFYQAQGRNADYTMTITQMLANPKNLSPEAAALQADVLKRYKQKYGLDRLGSLDVLGFEAAWNLFHYVLPKAGSLDPEAVRKAALAFNKSWKDSVMGVGCKYAPPGNPMAGTNLKAPDGLFVAQWYKGIQEIVYPSYLRTKDIVLPMPTWEQREKMK